MRIFPRISIPKFKKISRKAKRLSRYLNVSRGMYISESILFFGILIFSFTGRRGAYVDNLGHRWDLFVFIALSVLFVGIHLLAKRFIKPILDARFAPAKYDDRRILFDLGQEARTAINLDQLYKSIVVKIGDALQTEDVSVLVRDDITGDFVCRMSSLKMSEIETSGHGRPTIILSKNAFVVKRLRNLMLPLAIEPADFEMWMQFVGSGSAQARDSRLREIETLKKIKSELLLKVTIKDQVVGILSLGPRLGKFPYSSADKEMLMSVAGQLAFVIENSKLIERMVAEERLKRELLMAAEVQQRLFPAEPPASDCLELAGYCQPARGVGGDYYDFLRFDNQQIGFAVADVAGKGISAALVMSAVQASLRSQVMMHNSWAETSSSLADLIANMNWLLCGSTGSSTYATFFYGQFDERTLQMTYVNAGHNPPILLRPYAAARTAVAETVVEAHRDPIAEMTDAGGALSAVALARAQKVQQVLTFESDADGGSVQLTVGGPVIGLFEQCPYEQQTVQMASGDVLALFTDGVTEANNTDGDEFGEDRLRATLHASSHLPVEEIRSNIIKDVDKWCAGAPQHDDLTFIIIKVK